MCQTSNHPANPGVSHFPTTKDRNRPLFPLGRVVTTRGVLAHLVEHCVEPGPYIHRHQCGDWGTVCRDDARENDLSLENGFRVLSGYDIAGERVWIITEADRSSTTLLFPSEY